MSVIDDSNSSQKPHRFDINKLTKELCLMTGCDQELATFHLINYNFDIQLATEKILESLSTVTPVDDGWQTINRHKKSKKKEIRNGMDGDNVKTKTSFNSNAKNRNHQPGNYKTDDRQNYNRPRYKKYTNPKTSKDELEYLNSCELKPTDHAGAIIDLNEELRWDNLADIEGGLMESGTNSIADCFYSDDDFGLAQSFEDTYQDTGVELGSEVDNIVKTNINDENLKHPEKSSKPINDPLNECLSQQLPIFGKFSQTEPPKPVSLILNRPVSFVMPLKLLKKYSKFQYKFGVNVSELLSASNSTDLKFANSHDKSISITNHSDRGDEIGMNVLDNNIASSNNPNFNNIILPNTISKPNNIEGIISTILKQQKEVAMLFGGQHPAQSYYPYSKPINVIPISNSNHMGPVYSMQMNPENLQKDIENGLTHNSDCFIQNSFPTSINVSVPFHLAKK